MISIINLILESIDIYSLEDMEEREMTFEIEREDRANFIASFVVAGREYKIEIRKGYGKHAQSHDFSFGDIKSNGTKNVSDLLKAGVPLPVCSRVFSLLRYYLDKYNVSQFSYQINGNVRESLYIKEERGMEGLSTKLVIWTKN